MARKRFKPMPSYFANEEETEWCLFCRRNNIRISPLAIQNDPDHWRITINLGPYKKGEKQNISPKIYDRSNIWQEYYKMCKYYYDKYRDKL
mgnify:FL=1|tara:strand:- start:1316 stop:1588 length:273 start_codon:yes stop_codon:yes gene_type:complete